MLVKKIKLFYRVVFKSKVLIFILSTLTLMFKVIHSTKNECHSWFDPLLHNFKGAEITQFQLS